MCTLEMGLPLGPVLANDFMIKLETTLIPNLNSKLPSWRCFVDDSISFVEKGSIKFVPDTLNIFHTNIKFTFEEEIDGKIPFLDAMLVSNSDYIVTTVYRKETNINIYLNWNSFGPNNCKWGTLRAVVTRALLIDQVVQGGRWQLLRV